MSLRRATLGVAFCAITFVACASAPSTPRPSATPPASTATPASSSTRKPSVPPPSTTPSPSSPAPSVVPTKPAPIGTRPPSGGPSGSPAGPGVIVTIAVGTDRYRILLIDPTQIAIAQDLLAGKQAPTIPNGKLLRGVTGVNTGHTWSIDPSDIQFADMTMELCDGNPGQIDDGSFTADRFCPWTGKVVAVEATGR